MTAVQLSFSLRTSPNVKTVHLLGTWDNYKGQLPLSNDPSRSGGWKGVFKFQGGTLKRGQRYWYYYIIDGYHVSHDPSQEHTTEPTTQRKLNILDVPPDKDHKGGAPRYETSSAPKDKGGSSYKRNSRHTPHDIPKGRPLSVSKIEAPHPKKPYATQYLTMTDFSSHPTVEQLSKQFASHRVSDYRTDERRPAGRDKYTSDRYPPNISPGISDYSDNSSEIDSDVGSDVPSLTSRSSGSSSSSSIKTGSSSSGGSARSSPSSLSSSSSSCCTCERYGITRKGDRVKLDCGGSRCGYSSDSASCNSDSEEEVYRIKTTRRQGIVVRGPGGHGQGYGLGIS